MASFGEILKRERELRGISLREISEATKIGIRTLEALENSRIEDLPGGLFNKGFIRAYSIHVGIDPDEMINNYLYDVGQMEEKDPLESLRAMIPAEKTNASTRWRQWTILGGILAGGLLLFFVLSLSTPSLQGDSNQHSAMEKKEIPPVVQPVREVPASPDLEAGSAEPEKEIVLPAPTPPTEKRPISLPDLLTLDLVVKRFALLRVQCDGTEVLNKRLEPGARRSFTCKEVQISASDSGAFRYRVDGTDWVTPGAAGTPLQRLHLTPASKGDGQKDRDR